MKTIHIRNMVCDRCIAAVREVIGQFKTVEAIALGEVVIPGELSRSERSSIDKKLREIGFELIDDRKTQLAEAIRTAIIERVHGNQEPDAGNLSAYLRKRIGHDYPYLSARFSESEGITIEKYYIAQRIEKVKELLMYNELSVAQIAHRMGYSSAAYLSNQFKAVTGMTPGAFRSLGKKPRLPLDKV